MIYPNFDDWASLSTNHVEIGEHNKKLSTENIQNQFTLPLLDFDRKGLQSILDLPHRRPILWEGLPILDLWGNVTTEDAIVSIGRLAARGLGSCPPSSIINVPSALTTYDARELLCPRRESQSRGISEELALPEDDGEFDRTDLDFEVEIDETIHDVASGETRVLVGQSEEGDASEV